MLVCHVQLLYQYVLRECPEISVTAFILVAPPFLHAISKLFPPELYWKHNKRNLTTFTHLPSEPSLLHVPIVGEGLRHSIYFFLLFFFYLESPRLDPVCGGWIFQLEPNGEG